MPLMLVRHLSRRLVSRALPTAGSAMLMRMAMTGGARGRWVGGEGGPGGWGFGNSERGRRGGGVLGEEPGVGVLISGGLQGDDGGRAGGAIDEALGGRGLHGTEERGVVAELFGE